ncbi:MAG: hypothetical protein IT436_03120 [Phycisphaerales bacterium]|nr:hypothetical protein [Phycisphaerales bacterium]
MHRANIEQVRGAYSRLAPRLDHIAQDFFEKAFAADPSLRPLFPPTLARPVQQLTASIALVWKNLDRLAALEAPLMELGRRNAELGIKPGHYPVFRDALLASLEDGAGEPWPDRLRDAWSDVLNGIGAIMLKGAARAALEAAEHLSGESRPWDSPRPR